MEATISRLAAFGMVVDAERYLRQTSEPNQDALRILVQCETKLRNELWSKHGWGHEPRTGK
jgi:hypothetical protein